MKKTSIILFILIGVLFGCAKETKGIKQVILRYNKLLAEGYKNMNMNPMQEVATSEHATKLYYHMAALGEANIKMISELKNIEFKEMIFPAKDKAVARAREAWDFTHYDVNSGEKKT